MRNFILFPWSSLLLCLLLSVQSSLAQRVFKSPLSASQRNQAVEVQVQVLPSTKKLVPAERSYLTFVFKGLSQAPSRTAIEIADADVFYVNTNANRITGQTTYYVNYHFQALQQGVYTIPPITFLTNRGKITSKPTKITVHSKEKLVKKTVTVDNKTFSYYTLLLADKTSLFPNETTAIEYKVYLPNKFTVALWGLPLGDKTNCTAWRFRTPNRGALLSKARIDGSFYQGGSYQTNLTALNSGKASIGSLQSRIVYHTRVMSRGLYRNKQSDFHLYSKKLDLDVKKLPPNQPDSFQGDVGNYLLNAEISAPEEITDNDSIRAIVQLRGTGNLAMVKPPKLTGMDGWKVISENRTDLGENRKLTTGTAEFTYLLQPDLSEPGTLPPTATPGFQFTGLNPDIVAYYEMKIPGKPITVIPTALVSTSSDTTTDSSSIALIIREPSSAHFSKAWFLTIPIGVIYILPLGFIGYLLFRVIRSYFRTRKSLNSETSLKQQAFQQLKKTDADFLKSAGAFVERWIDTEKHPKAKKILQLRDNLCFRPAEESTISNERRQKILSVIQKSLLLVLCCFSLHQVRAETAVTDSFQAGMSDYIKKQYPLAAAHFLAIPDVEKKPDLLFNIGLCYQLNNQPGTAAQFYHKALALEKDHPSASKNLAYIENQNSSITGKKLTDLERWIRTLSPESYLHLTYFFCAILLCLLLTFFILKPKAGYFRLTLILTILSPIFLFVCIYSYLSHPDKETSALPQYLVLKEAQMRDQPLSSSHAILDAPPASLCYLVAKRGRFSYIILANGVRGWIESKQIANLE